jgi:hypothetical protein
VVWFSPGKSEKKTEVYGVVPGRKRKILGRETEWEGNRKVTWDEYILVSNCKIIRNMKPT